MNYCPSCGTANRDGSRFCNECGHKLPSKTGIICPMCSHVNPAANVYCDRCQARLVPLTPASRSEAPPSSAPAAAAAPIKKGLSLPTKPADESAEPGIEAPLAQPAEPDEAPEWLARLRASAPEVAAHEPTPAAQQPASDLPDWMRPAEAEEPDWFKRISEAVSPTTPQPAEPAPQAGDEELPSWMGGFDLEPPGETKAVPSASQPPDETRKQPAPAEGELDWLQQLRGEPAPIEQAGEAPDWLTSRSAESATPETDVPDWLKQLQGDSEPPAPASGAAISEPAGGISDEANWRASLHMQAAEPPEPTLRAAEGSRTGDEARAEELPADEPDWLAALRGASQTEAPSEAPEAEPRSAWLTQPTEASAAPATGEAPDWLRDITMEAAPTETPDWLRDIGAGAPTPAEAEDVTAFTPGPTAAFVGEEAEPAEPGLAAPAWLADIAQPPPPVEAQPAQPAEMPAWLRDIGPMPKEPARSEETPFGELPPAPLPAQVPDWLRAMQPGIAAPTFADEAGRPIETVLDQSAAESAGLAAATIPPWLQALRPTEAAAEPVAGADAGRVESEGLLAGLSNVLPASPFMSAAQGTPAVTRARASAADLARAGLFQELLARGALAPTIVQAGLRPRFRVRDRIGRWIVALLILAAAFTPNFGDYTKNLFELGAVNTQLYGPAMQQVETLTAGDRVLIVFDYDAFQSREMDPIAEAFLIHLQRAGASVLAASLNPAGQSIARQVLQKVNAAEAPDLAFDAQGYFPGQAAGAQNALAASQAKLIVLLTGSPESLRWWIEQVAASGTPAAIVAGASAGALPQLQPYAQSGQVQAIVPGLVGGLAYQRALDPELDAGEDGLNRLVQSEGLYLLQIVFILILVAGVVASLLARGARQTP